MTDAQKVKFIHKTRMTIAKFLEVMMELNAITKEYVALDVGNALEAGNFSDGDITKAQFTGAVSSINTIETALSNGHYTNLYGVRIA